MGMMARMRGLASWFIIGVGGLFVLFMVISDSKVTDITRQQSFEIGSINGQPVTQQEFSQMVDNFKENRESQTGQPIPESQMDEFRDYVWDALVSQQLIQEKIKDFGITVSDEEIKDAIVGEDPPAFLKQGFIDSSGNFNRDAYLNAIYDPNNSKILIQVEDQVRQQKIQQKLLSYIGATVLVTDDEVKRDFIDKNIKATLVYAAVSARSIPDSMVSVSESDIKSYYNDNKNDYATPEKRAVQYAIFSTNPTAEDSNNIKNQLNTILTKLKSDTSSFKTYAELYSSEPYKVDTFAISSFSQQVQSLIPQTKPGEIIGPVLSNQSFVLIKLDKTIKSNDTFVRASHILVSKTGNDQADKAKADSVYKALVNGADFAATAREISQDPGSGSRGGDLGWFGRGRMVKEFDEACFTGKVGVIQKPVKTNFGYHIIKVTGKTSEKYVVEQIGIKIQASGSTIENANNKAGDFSYLAKKDGFETSAKDYGYKIMSTPLFQETDAMIPGIGKNTALSKFVFENGKGDVSDAFKIQAGYVVAMISEVNPEGFVPVEDVKASIESKLKNEKKIDAAFEIIKDAYEKVKEDGDINKARNVNPLIKVDAASSVSSSSPVQGIGRDYAFTGYAINGELNKVSEPIRGTNGCYLIKVTHRTAFDSTTFAVQKASLKSKIAQTKLQTIQTSWLEKLKDEADIVDERYKFYR